GVVLVSGGELKLSTRGRTLTLSPQMDGITKVVNVKRWKGTGSRVEVTLRGELADHADPDLGLFDWAEEPVALAGGTRFQGGWYPWWYGPGAFWELLQAAGSALVERVVAGLDGCTAREKVASVVAGLAGRACRDVSHDEAGGLLRRARSSAREVNAARLGK